jgi:hypothetical protein
MLEHLADLLNVLNEPGYSLQLVAENAHSDNKVITSYRDAVAGDLLEDPIIEEITELLTEIQARDGKKEQSRKDKISNARQYELPTLYTLLCGMTHPNLTSLLARHRQSDGSLGYRCPPPAAVYDMLLSMALRLLSLTIRQLPSFTDCDSLQVADFADYVDTTNIQIQNGPER